MSPVSKAESVKAGMNGAGEAAAIDQVRDLLFGGAQRTLESRLEQMERVFDAKIAGLKAEHAERLAQLQEQLAAAERDAEQKRLNSIKDIGAAIGQLGTTINKLAASHKER